MKDGADHFEFRDTSMCGSIFRRWKKMSSSKRTTRTYVDEYSLKDGRKINLLGEGRLIICRRRRAIRVGDGYEFCRPGAFGRVPW